MRRSPQWWQELRSCCWAQLALLFLRFCSHHQRQNRDPAHVGQGQCRLDGRIVRAPESSLAGSVAHVQHRYGPARNEKDDSLAYGGGYYHDGLRIGVPAPRGNRFRDAPKFAHLITQDRDSIVRSGFDDSGRVVGYTEVGPKRASRTQSPFLDKFLFAGHPPRMPNQAYTWTTFTSP